MGALASRAFVGVGCGSVGQLFRSEHLVLVLILRAVSGPSICRHLVLATKRASARRGSRMRSTSEAGMREAYVLDARLVVSPKMFASSERLSHSVGSIKRELMQLRDPWSEPDCMTRSVSRAGSNSHTVTARNGRTPIPRAPRQWLRRTRPFWSSAFEAKSSFGSFTWIRPDLSGPGRFEKPLRVLR